MALATILILASIIWSIKEKMILLPLLCVVTGIFLMSTGGGVGPSIHDTLTSVSTSVDGIFTKK